MMKNQIINKLKESLNISHLEVIDESGLHKGHAGAREGGETHYRVIIKSADFNGKSRVEQHKIINKILAHELATTVHALAIEASPDN